MGGKVALEHRRVVKEIVVDAEDTAVVVVAVPSLARRMEVVVAVVAGHAPWRDVALVIVVDAAAPTMTIMTPQM